MQRETQMQRKVGTQDQLVPALEEALTSHPRAKSLKIWSTPSSAFGESGSPKVQIPAMTPLWFDVEVIQ